MTSVIIPAFNEEAVIGRTLASLLASVGDRDVEIVVVCNACHDRTAEVARGFGRKVTVIETPQGGKCNAINLGEQQAQTFPRIYLDADITVSPSFVDEMENAFGDPGVYAAWPDVRYDLSESGWLVAGFYRVWTALPYNRPGRIGVGAYAVSEAGRATFGPFPNIISDDGYIRGLFEADKRRIVGSCHTVVLPPRNLQSLVSVRIRSRMGVDQLRREHPEVMRRHSTTQELNWRDATRCLRPDVLFFAPVYAGTVLITKLLAKRRRRAAASEATWSRDLSQRPVTRCEEVSRELRTARSQQSES